MRLIILDEDFNILGPVSTFKSLLWIRRYDKLGAFELYATINYFPLFTQGKFLYRNDRDELGVIRETKYYTQDTGTRLAYAKGYFAESLLEGRVIEKTITLSGSTEDCMRSLVNTYAINPADSERVIPNLALGSKAGVGESISCQVTGEDVSSELYTLGNADGISHRIRYDFENDKLIFEVWEGKDRRDSQTENSWAVFSNSFFNIRNPSYTNDRTEYKNYAYVAGEGEGDDRTVVEVDIRDDISEERLELYVDARDIQSEDDDGNAYTTEEYEELLAQRGREKLAEFAASEIAEVEIDNSANLTYREDFDLGDYCTYVNTDIGIEMEERITEIQETYEKKYRKHISDVRL